MEGRKKKEKGQGKMRKDREKRERGRDKEGREEGRYEKGGERNSLLPMGDFYGLRRWEDRRRRSTTSLTFTKTAPERERLMASS